MKTPLSTIVYALFRMAMLQFFPRREERRRQKLAQALALQNLKNISLQHYGHDAITMRDVREP